MEVRNNAAKGRFEVELDGEVAFAEYRIEDEAIVFPHTLVPPAFEGRGVGGALVREGLAFAKEKGLPVKPVCPFFAAYIAKRPEYHSMVHRDFRERLGIES